MKEEKRNIFFSKSLKVLYTILFLLASSIFVGSMILLRQSVQEGNPVPSKESSYEQTAHCGRQMIKELQELESLLQAGERYFGNGQNTRIDITNPENSMDATMHSNTTYCVTDIQKFIEDGSLDYLIQEIESAHNMPIGSIEESWKKIIEDTHENHYLGKANIELFYEGVFSDEFTYLYSNAMELEKILPVSNMPLADYVLESYLEHGEYQEEIGESSEEYTGDSILSLRDLYLQLINVAKDFQTYDSELRMKQRSSNFLFYVKNHSTGQVFTNYQNNTGNNQKKTLEGKEEYQSWVKVVRENGNSRVEQRKGVTEQHSSCMIQLENFLMNNSILGEDEEVVVALNSSYPIKDQFYQFSQEYDRNKIYVKIMIACGIVAFCMMLIMIGVCGKSMKNKDFHVIWTEKIPTEMMLLICMLFVGFYGIIIFGRNFHIGHRILNYISMCTVGLLMNGALLVACLSLVRRIKAGLLWKTSLVYGITVTSKKATGTRKTVIQRILLFGCLFLGNVVFIRYLDGIGIIMSGIINGVMLLYLIREATGRQVIFHGLGRIASGELDYQIDTKGLIGETKDMAEAVNHVGDGLSKAVQETVKSERLKADLITNVSHDIKTPLTSIINYVDLIKRENIQNDKIKGYIEVLDKKSQRLKHLTEDLVEASKISSGNIVLTMEPIRLGELILQTNGEFEEKFAEKNLELVCNISEGRNIILADGRRMWRVLENLYNNAAKYAMPHTRIYVTLKRREERIVFEIKNISNMPLNVKPEELTQRFVRGDVSRSTEGSGLGLSIASNLVKMQKGTFEIGIDGDLFKIVITFESEE